MSHPSETTSARPADELPRELLVAIAPLHKSALGLAVGIAASFGLAALTLVHMWRSPGQPYPLDLLSQYLRGYEVSWKGVWVGAFWGFWVGFCGGWFFAWLRNFVVGLILVIVHAKAEMAESGDILDHL